MRRFMIFVLCLIVALSASPIAAQRVPTFYVNVRAARVRAEADPASKTLAILKRDTPVLVLEVVPGEFVGEVNTWYHVRAGKIDGYMLKTLLSDRAPSFQSFNA